MFIDKTHLRWLLLVCGGTPALIVLYRYMASERLTYCYGCLAVLCCLVANLLVFRKRLAGKRVKLGTWQRAHLHLSFLSIPLVLSHCRCDFGWPQGVGFWLVSVYWAIVASGLVALLCHHLGPLVKFGEKGKAKISAAVIEVLKYVALDWVHVPLSATFWLLVAVHVFAKIYY